MTNYQFDSAINQKIFRAYDIRGIVDQGIDENSIYTIGLAIGSEALAQGESHILMAYDGRVSAPRLYPALCAGLSATGLQVIMLGAVPTPVLYYATKTHQQTQSGVMLTASHNPAEYNGLKTVIKGKTLAAEGVNNLLRRIQQRDITTTESPLASLSQTNIIDDYIKAVTKHHRLQHPCHVVIDCANGITGPLAPKILRAIGCEVTELYTEIDGRFPHHEADPTIPENLSTLITTVKQQHADIGLAFDGDGDRLGVVTERGDIIWPDRQLMLFAEHVLQKHPGANIIFDVKCTQQLPDLISRLGGTPIISRTGHSLIKQAMLDHQAPLAGEMSGHIFFNDNWYGCDDGIYTAVRLLNILDQQRQTVGELFAHYGDVVNTPELKIAIDDDDKFALIEELQQKAVFADATLIDIDGLRVSFDDGWGLVRASNTSPSLTTRFEAINQQALQRIQAAFREQIKRLRPNLTIPF